MSTPIQSLALAVGGVWLHASHACKVMALAVACLLGLMSPAQAQQTLSGTLSATMVLTSGCVIFGGSEATSGVNFGVLDFGTRPSTFTGTATADVTGGDGGSGSTQVLCSPDVEGYTLAIGPGVSPGQGTDIGVGSRAMTNGASFLPYEVYQDPGYQTPYPVNVAGVALTIATPGTPFTLPIYGQVNKTSAVALTEGTYTDTLQVTLSF